MGGLDIMHMNQMGLEAMAETRFCKDCKFYTLVPSGAECANPYFYLPETTDLVSGDTHREARLCAEARSDEALCGTYGRGFEPK